MPTELTENLRDVRFFHPHPCSCLARCQRDKHSELARASIKGNKKAPLRANMSEIELKIFSTMDRWLWFNQNKIMMSFSAQ